MAVGSEHAEHLLNMLIRGLNVKQNVSVPAKKNTKNNSLSFCDVEAPFQI